MMNEGDYQGCIETAAVTTARTGTPQMEIGVWVDEQNRRTVYMPLTDTARSTWVDATLEFLGFNGNFADPVFDAKFYEPGELPLRCKHDAYNDKPNEKWEINRGGRTNTPAGRDIVARLNADWKARHGGAKPGGPPPAKPSTPPVRSAPPARSNPPPAKTEPKTFGKDEAWAAWEEEYAKSGKPVDTELWHLHVAEFGKEETFGETEWRKVAELAGVPF